MGPLLVAAASGNGGGTKSQLGGTATATTGHHQMQIGANTTSNSKPIERPLKNKFVHKAGMVQQAPPTTQKVIPLYEKPRNMGGTTSSALDASDHTSFD